MSIAEKICDRVNAWAVTWKGMGVASVVVAGMLIENSFEP